MNIKTSIATIAVGVSVFGAGCLPYQSPAGSRTTPVKIPNGPSGVAATNGFGKLPLFASAAPTSPSANGTAAPLAAPAPASAQDTKSAMMLRPIPMPPPPQHPTTITYDVTSDLPTWGVTDNVLRAQHSNYSSSNIVALAQATGLPGEAIGNAPTLEGLTFAWKDQDKLEWSYDASQRMVSFWKQTDGTNSDPQKELPKYDDAEMIRLADAFLTQHGFGGIVRGNGVVEKPWGSGSVPETATAPGMPCPYVYTTMDKAVSNIAPSAVVGSSGSGVAQAEPATIAPAGVPTPGFAPCWIAPQVTVTYNAMRDGKSIRDANGWPFNNVTITINLKDRTVSNGAIWLDQTVDVSSYPLIDRAEALKRLQSGGRNPIWPWMENGGTIAARIKTVTLSWMRYDVWSNNRNETYYIPALVGDGEVEYATDNIQPYHTTVPLVADDAFEPIQQPIPVPLPMGSGGGSAGDAPAGTATVPPQIK